MALWQEITMFSVEVGDEREAFVKVHLCVMGVESKN